MGLFRLRKKKHSLILWGSNNHIETVIFLNHHRKPSQGLRRKERQAKFSNSGHDVLNGFARARLDGLKHDRKR